MIWIVIRYYRITTYNCGQKFFQSKYLQVSFEQEIIYLVHIKVFKSFFKEFVLDWNQN